MQVKRYPLHALFLCCKNDEISSLDPFDLSKYRTENQWESWSKFGIPRNYHFKGIDLIQLVDNIDYEMRFKSYFGTKKIGKNNFLILLMRTYIYGLFFDIYHIFRYICESLFLQNIKNTVEKIQGIEIYD